MLALALACFHPPCPAASAHVHGQAVLTVAIDGGTLTLRLHSPLDSLLAFERAPRSPAENAAVEKLLQQLRQPEALFVPTAAARCAPVFSAIDAPVLGVVREPVAKKSLSEKKARERSGQNGHAELVAEISFKCNRPDQLRGLEAKLFDQFRRLRRIDVQVAGARGQSSARLTPARRTLAW